MSNVNRKLEDKVRVQEKRIADLETSIGMLAGTTEQLVQAFNTLYAQLRLQGVLPQS